MEDLKWDKLGKPPFVDSFSKMLVKLKYLMELEQRKLERKSKKIQEIVSNAKNMR